MVTTAIAGLAACLAALARGRDAAAWGWLIDRAGADMARVAGRLAGDAALANDAIHEALLRIRDDAGDFTVRSADADGDAWGWIMRVTANAALQLVRRQRRQRDRDRHAYVPQPSHPPAPDAALEHGEHATLVRRELAELSEPTRAAIVLHVMEGLGYDRVATELRIPVGTAKTRVHRGLETLRRRLTKAGCVLSLGALGTALQQLPAASCPFAGATLLPLLTTTQASTIGAISAGGLAMSAKIAIGIAAMLAVVATPIVLSQEGGVPKTAPTPGALAEEPRPGSVDPAFQAKLDQRVTFDFAQTDFVDAMAFMKRLGVNWRVASPTKPEQLPTITLKVTDIRTEDALKWISQLAGTTMTVRRDVVVFGQEKRKTSYSGRLAQMVTFDFNQVNFNDIVKFLNDVGVPCIVQRPSTAEIFPPITLKVEGVQLEDALHRIARLADATLIMRDDALVFSGPHKR